MKPQRLTWERLVAKLPPATQEADTPPPFGFATRVVAQWRAARRDESLRRWAKWSFRTALASTAACALLTLVRAHRDSSILMPLPEVPSAALLPTPP
jgi:hypothetical protein